MKLKQIKEKVGIRLIICYLVLIGACFISSAFNGINELQVAIILFSFANVAPTAINLFSFIVNGTQDSIILIEKKQLETIGKKLINRNCGGTARCVVNNVVKDYYTSILEFTSFDSNKILSKSQVFLIQLVTLGHPALALLILILKSFNFVSWSDATLLTISTLGSLVFGVFWNTVFHNLFKE